MIVFKKLFDIKTNCQAFTLTTPLHSKTLSPKYLFLSLHPKSKIVGHIKKANFAVKINPLPVFVQKLGTAQ